MKDVLLFLELSQTSFLRRSKFIQSVYLTQTSPQVGDIYLGRVNKLLPTFNAAFVQLNNSFLNGFLHFHDLSFLKKNNFKGEISNFLVPEQKVLVQVIKEPTGTKGPRLTMNLTLTGRFLVFVPFGSGISFSNSSNSLNCRNIFNLLTKVISNLPSQFHIFLTEPVVFGLVVRPFASYVTEEILLREFYFLLNQWCLILKKLNQVSTVQVISRDFNYIYRVLRDLELFSIHKIFATSILDVKNIFSYLKMWGMSSTLSKEFFYLLAFSELQSEAFFLNTVLRQLLKPKILLPSGGSIIIHPTEAFIAIDVNSGSYFEGLTLRSNLLQVNIEAAKEIAFQLKLRNLSGAIVIDFIDMSFFDDQKCLLLIFSHYLSFDDAKPQIIQLSELGFVELTRRRYRSNLYEVSSSLCSKFGLVNL